jgi:Protein of unknown function (DUF1236)
MPSEMSRRQEQRGTGWMLGGAVVLAIIVGIGLVVWFFLPNFGAPEKQKNAGTLSNQTVGMSTASKQEPLPTTSPRSTDSDTVARNQDINATAKGDLRGMSREQVQAIQQFAANNAQQGAQQVNFSIAVGGAVPEQVKLADFPPQLAQAMPDYAKDQYFIVNNQFVVVERQTRRIVAIVPTHTTKESAR